MTKKYPLSIVQSFLAKIKHTLAGPSSGSSLFYVRKPAAGVAVTHENALTYSAVWSCVHIISETISALGWHVFEGRAGGDGKDRRSGHLDYMLSVQANPEMTAQTFRETVLAWTLLWGNGYAEIERDMAGRVKWLWPIHPERVKIDRDEQGRIIYEVSNERGPSVIVPFADMFHLKGLGYDGIQGYSVVGMASSAISLGMACEQFGSSYFGSGTNPGSILEVPGKLSQPAYDRLKDSMSAHAGMSNAKKNMILEEGMTHKHLAVPPEDSQFIETRKLQVEDIARFFRMPLHKMADLTNSSFSNIEQQNIEFVTDTIWPWVTRIESEANMKLFPDRQRGKVFSKLNMNSLLRGDVVTRAEYYRTMVNIGVMSVNEIRGLEDLNPLGADGDKHYMQLNMTTIDKVGMEPPGGGGSPDETDNTVIAHTDLFRDAFARLDNFESRKVQSGMNRYDDRVEFSQWFKRELSKHKSKVIDRISPPAVALYKSITKQDDPSAIINSLAEFADRYIEDLYDIVMKDGKRTRTVAKKADELIDFVVSLSMRDVKHEEKNIN